MVSGDENQLIFNDRGMLGLDRGIQLTQGKALLCGLGKDDATGQAVEGVELTPPCVPAVGVTPAATGKHGIKRMRVGFLLSLADKSFRLPLFVLDSKIVAPTRAGRASS